MSAHARLRLFQDGGAANGTSGSWIGGIYENTANFENGEWKFGIQDLHHIFNARIAMAGSCWRGWWLRRREPHRLVVQQRLLLVLPAVRQQLQRVEQRQQQVPVARRRIRVMCGAAASPRNRWHVDGQLVQGLPGGSQDPRAAVRIPEIVEPAFHYANPVSGRPPKDGLISSGHAGGARIRGKDPGCRMLVTALCLKAIVLQRIAGEAPGFALCVAEAVSSGR